MKVIILEKKIIKEQLWVIKLSCIHEHRYLHKHNGTPTTQLQSAEQVLLVTALFSNFTPNNVFSHNGTTNQLANYSSRSNFDVKISIFDFDFKFEEESTLKIGFNQHRLQICKEKTLMKSQTFFSQTMHKSGINQRNLTFLAECGSQICFGHN